MSDVMIEARELTKRYGPVTALKDVSFEVRRGEVVGFLGPNGAGKTTAMKVLTCFIAPTEGTAKVNGIDVFEDSLAIRRAIGYLPEHTPLYVEMLVLEYLDFVARIRGFTSDVGRKRIKRVVEQTGLGDVIGKEIRALSKGYRQRVGLAQALVHEPPILILDEPLSGLDPNQAAEIRDLIKDIGRERTVMLSTHDLSEVQRTCDRVLIVSKGRIVADDTVDQLRSRTGRRAYSVTVLMQGVEAPASSAFQAPAGSIEAVEGRCRDAFGAIKGVDAVRRAESSDPKEAVFDVVVNDDAGDVRAAIVKAAAASGLVLVGVGKAAEDLGRVFKELTTAPAPAAKGKKKKAAVEEDEEDEDDLDDEDEDLEDEEEEEDAEEEEEEEEDAEEEEEEEEEEDAEKEASGGDDEEEEDEDEDDEEEEDDDEDEEERR